MDIYTGLPSWMIILNELYVRNEEYKTQKLYDTLREQKHVLTYSFLSKMLSGIEEKGYITKYKKGRCITLKLTKKGYNIGKAVNEVLKNA